MRRLPTMYFSNASKKDERLKLAFCHYSLSQQLSQHWPLSLPTPDLLAATMARAHLSYEMTDYFFPLSDYGTDIGNGLSYLGKTLSTAHSG